MATDPLGRTIPDLSATADVPGAFSAFSLSAKPGPMTVTSRAQANNVVSAITAAGSDAAGLHVWRSDTNQEERWNGSVWEYVAGRQHGAIVELERENIPAGGTPYLLYATRFVKASPGWTIAGNSVVIPQAGVYDIYNSVNISGTTGSLGRVFGQMAIAGQAERERFGTATNENNYSGDVMLDLTDRPGARLQLTHYHEGGGARTVTARMLIVMRSVPNWD